MNGRENVNRYPDAEWRKSTKSGDGDCVEVAPVPEGIAVRDSKDRAGAVLIFTADEWTAFVAGAQDGEFNFPA